MAAVPRQSITVYFNPIVNISVNTILILLSIAEDLPPINQRIVRASGLEFAIAQEMNTAVTPPHQNNANGILSTLLSALFADRLSTKAVPQRCGDVL
jgi:hypothetical protein